MKADPLLTAGGRFWPTLCIRLAALLLLGLLLCVACRPGIDSKIPAGRLLQQNDTVTTLPPAVMTQPPSALSDAAAPANGTTLTNTTNTTIAVVTVRDFVDPQTLQPYWLLVITNCFLVVAQSAAFGLDLKFSKPAMPPIPVLLFVAMSICTWRPVVVAELEKVAECHMWLREASNSAE
jgi:hypothetical protein